MKRVQRKSGFSLLEVQVGIFVATLTTFTAMGLMVASGKVSRQTNARVILGDVARHQLESIISVSQGNRNRISNQAFTIPANVTSQFSPAAAIAGTYSVESVSGTPNMQKVTVRVSWMSPASNYHTRSEFQVSKFISSVQDLTGGYNGTWTPGQPVYYVPPPPNPVPTTGTTGSTASTTGSTTSSTTGSTTGSTTSSTTGGTTGSTGSTSGSTTGSTTSSTGSTTGGQTNGGTGNPYFDPGSGNKW